MAEVITMWSLSANQGQLATTLLIFKGCFLSFFLWKAFSWHDGVTPLHHVTPTGTAVMHLLICHPVLWHLFCFFFRFFRSLLLWSCWVNLSSQPAPTWCTCTSQSFTQQCSGTQRQERAAYFPEREAQRHHFCSSLVSKLVFSCHS